MRKKTATTKKASAPPERLARPATKPKSKATTKPTAKQPTTIRSVEKSNPKPKRASQPRASKAPVIKAEEVALRAYFISENRRQQGLPGDEHQDWLEAERQVRSEASAKKNGAKKRTSAD